MFQPNKPAIIRGAIRVRADSGQSADTLKAIQDFKAQFDEFKSKQLEAEAAINDVAKASEAASNEAVKKALEAIEQVSAIAANLEEMEQKFAEKLLRGERVSAETVGQILIASDEYKSLGLNSGQTPPSNFSLRVEANTITGQGGSPVENVDTLVNTDRRMGITPGAFRRLRIRDLIPTINTSSNAWQFTRELLWTSAAAETAEGAAKPESTLTFEDATVNIRTIAHWIKASNQILADAPALRSYIDGRLTYGVELREETQIVAGNGSGQNISGMTASGNFTAFTPTSGDTAIDSVNRAIEAIEAADYIATGIVLDVADWHAMERLKNSQNEYLIGDPFGMITPVLWGRPVVVTNSMVDNKLLVADFVTSYEYVERQTTVVEAGYVDDDFTKNLVTLRAEKRGALATIRPASVRYGDLTA